MSLGSGETVVIIRIDLPARTSKERTSLAPSTKRSRSGSVDLVAQGMKVRVGMEASGHARWFERLLAELNFELWIGDAAEVRTKRVRKQKTDRLDAHLIL